jgi:hypothetical protein
VTGQSGQRFLELSGPFMQVRARTGQADSRDTPRTVTPNPDSSSGSASVLCHTLSVVAGAEIAYPFPAASVP